MKAKRLLNYCLPNIYTKQLIANPYFLITLLTTNLQLATLVVSIIEPFNSFAQGGVAINANGNLPNNSAMLDIDADNSGLLIPRIALTSLTDATTITTPATSLLVYNNGTGGLTPEGYYYWDGTQWVPFLTNNPSFNGGWSLTGNAGTTPGTNFIGTTDTQDWIIKTDNMERVRVLSDGKVGVGISNPTTNTGQGFIVYDSAGTSVKVQNNTVWSEMQAWQDTVNYLVFDGGDYRIYDNGMGPKVSIQDNSGNVGIGTTNPLTSLHVSDNDIILDDNTGAASYIARSTSYRTAGNEVGTFGYVSEGNAASGNIWPPQAAMKFIAAENHSATNKGTDIIFTTALNGTTADVDRVIIQDDGNVGIGNTTPKTKLAINTNATPQSANSSLILNTAAEVHSIGDAWIDLYSIENGGNRWAIQNNNNVIDAGELVFTNNGTSRVFFLPSGNVGLGTANPTSKLAIAYSPTMPAALSGNSNPIGINMYMLSSGAAFIDALPSMPCCNSSLSLRTSQAGTYYTGVYIHSNGNVGIGTNNPTQPLLMASGAHVTTAGVWMNGSDKKLKKNIRDLDKYGLNTILEMKPRSYSMKSTNEQQIGFIAQEMLEIVPEIVSTSSETMGISYGQITPILVNAIKDLSGLLTEQQQLIKNLQQDNAALKTQNTEFRTQNQQLIENDENLKAEIEEIKKILNQQTKRD